MCGITGGYYKKELPAREVLERSVSAISSRGPDNQALLTHGSVFLGHRRLSILDVRAAANQPFFSSDERYALIFNGEIYNFREIRDTLAAKGRTFRTTGDTEVLLYAWMEYGADCLELLNGFFAFAILDTVTGRIFAARDRLGIKPLHYYEDDDKVLFASEVKALYPLGIDRSIDYQTLATYFQLNYIPAPYGIYKKLRKLPPGHYMEIADGRLTITKYYSLPHPAVPPSPVSYDEAKKELASLLDEAVRMRLVSDVPLGTFLSGGIDSSIITSLAARHRDHLNTFSIGFRDNAFFDETHYAELVADRLKTNHRVFKLSNDDLLDSMTGMLAYIDEPFADSSALLVNLLSRHTREHVTVALSGDGGDELFAGYNKHYGEWRMRRGGAAAGIVSALLPLWKRLPKSRHSGTGNRIRQFERFAEGMRLSEGERYWRWCSFVSPDDSIAYFRDPAQLNPEELEMRRRRYTQLLRPDGDLNDNLYADTQLVLPYDMLTKVDLMSMANSLEVRVPLLDHRIAEFAFRLPVEYKINGAMKKRILQDAFRDELPAALYNRPKKGFEVPLLQWFRRELRSLIEDDLLEDSYIKDQQIFNLHFIRGLKKRLFSRDPGDVHAQIWALIVFQSWYRNYHLD